MLTFVFIISKTSLLFHACSFSTVPSSFLMDRRVFHTLLWLLMRAFFETFLFLFSLFLPQYISVHLFGAPLFILGAFSEYLVIPWLCWGSDDPQSRALLYCGPLQLFRNRSVICREGEAGEESRLWMNSSALSFFSPLPSTGISGSTSLSKVLQEKLAITIKTLEDSWGSVHADHSLRQTEVSRALLGVYWLPVVTQERWGVTALATLGPSSLGASFWPAFSWLGGWNASPVLWAGTIVPKELPMALAVPFNSGS